VTTRLGARRVGATAFAVDVAGQPSRKLTQRAIAGGVTDAASVSKDATTPTSSWPIPKGCGRNKGSSQPLGVLS